VLINTSTTAAYRPDIRGPLSLFCNLAGESLCATDGRFVRVSPDRYFLSNQGQEYTLQIDSPTPVQTFNIHFGDTFTRQTLQALLLPTDRLLTEPFPSGAGETFFLNKLYPQDETFRRLIMRMREAQQGGLLNRLLLEEYLQDFLVYLLHTHRNVLREVEKLPAVKASTKRELYRRLSFALDYLQSQYASPVQLEELAQAACLSKFHFLRLFKQAFRLSPYQYLQRLRIEKAQILLRQTNLPVHQIGSELGFENANSFSRLFYQRVKVYPSQYREAVR
jgi:AraC family transcriptional regulator